MIVDKAADVLIVNGDIRTLDALKPRARGLAARDGKIIALGNDEEVRSLAGGKSQIIDAGGRLVLPGFQDTHIHLQDSGTDRALFADLEAAATVEELQLRLAEFAARNNAGWIRGVGWFSGIFGERNLD